MRTWQLAVLLCALLLPGVMLTPVWRLAGLGAGEDDVLYYFPSRSFFHETIQDGHWPWLNPWTGLGRPYLADPQSAVWYPFTWLFAFLPPLWAYPICLWSHYAIALWGMYRLLRRAAMSRQAALFGGIAFAFCGFLLAHRAHFAMPMAAAWTPWVFWRLQRYAQLGGMRRLLWVALTAALQCLSGHVQIAAITALGSIVFLLAQRRRPDASGQRRRVAARWLICWVCVAGLFAVQWLPTFAYVRECTRTERGYRDFTENSYNPASVIGWVLPMFFGQRTPNFFDQPYWGPSHQVEQFAYAGVLPVVLALFAMRRGWRGSARRRPWVVLLIFALLLALGRFGPVCPLLYWLPGASLFRVPARAMLLFDLAVAALAASVIHDLGAALTPTRARLRAALLRWTRQPLLWALLVVGIPLALAAATFPLLPASTRSAALSALSPWKPAVLVPLLTVLLAVVALRFVSRRWRQPHWLWLLTALTATDLAVIGWTIDVPAGQRDPRALLSPPDRDVWLDAVRAAPHRLWVVTGRAGWLPGEYVKPLHKLAANTNMLVHVPSLTDYGPLQPKALTQRFDFAPWGETDKALDLLADTSWMPGFNVGWVLLCEPHWPAPQDCELVATTDDGMRLFRYPLARGEAYFADAAQPGAIRYTASGPNAFTTHIDTWPSGERWAGGAGQADSSQTRVVVSRLALPGWQATVNGRDVSIERAGDLLLSVNVDANEPVTVEWAYFPPGLREGALVSLLSITVLVLFAAFEGRRG